MGQAVRDDVRMGDAMRQIASHGSNEDAFYERSGCHSGKQSSQGGDDEGEISSAEKNEGDENGIDLEEKVDDGVSSKTFFDRCLVQVHNMQETLNNLNARTSSTPDIQAAVIQRRAASPAAGLSLVDNRYKDNSLSHSKLSGSNSELSASAERLFSPLKSSNSRIYNSQKHKEQSKIESISEGSESLSQARSDRLIYPRAAQRRASQACSSLELPRARDEVDDPSAPEKLDIPEAMVVAPAFNLSAEERGSSEMERAVIRKRVVDTKKQPMNLHAATSDSQRLNSSKSSDAEVAEVDASRSFVCNEASQLLDRLSERELRLLQKLAEACGKRDEEDLVLLKGLDGKARMNSLAEALGQSSRLDTKQSLRDDTANSRSK